MASPLVLPIIVPVFLVALIIACTLYRADA